jgi:hypothetical protein
MGACGLDPLRLTERRVSDHVSLRKFPSNEYYIVTDRLRTQGAILAGPVRRIGWNDRVILVQRSLNKTEVWVRIHPSSGEVSEPLSPEAAQEAVSLAGLRTVRADSAWASLEW